MLPVLITVDVEIWCGGWNDLDRRFPPAYRRHIYGPGGQWGVPYQLSLFDAHGLAASWFVEPLFAERFGVEPLAEIIGLVQRGRHDVELHLHPEWADEARMPILSSTGSKRPYLFQYSVEEQSKLIGAGLELLRRAGARRPKAFRAGNFAMNEDTLVALRHQGIENDSSFNPVMWPRPKESVEALEREYHTMTPDVRKVPVTLFNDGLRLRHAQLSACSWKQMEALLWRSLERGDQSFVVFLHNFELLRRNSDKPDEIVVDRLKKLCAFLERNADAFRTTGFRDTSIGLQVPSSRLKAPYWLTPGSLAEQLLRRSRRAREVRA